MLEPWLFLLHLSVPGAIAEPGAFGSAAAYGAVPLWLKLGYSCFVAVLVPVYYRRYGPGNFLWFSDLALFGGLVAVWMESSLVVSMMTVSVLLPEVAWNFGYFTRLLVGKDPFGLTGYMFDPAKSYFLRGLSLFHVVLPPLLVWLVFRLGYHPQAWLYQTTVAWVVLPLCFFFTKPQANINWVRGPGEKQQYALHPYLYLLVVMLFFPLVIYLPTHFVLKFLFD